jgi:hypothetical protein
LEKEVFEFDRRVTHAADQTIILKKELYESQLKVSKICSMESLEICKMQDERDQQLAVYDKAIEEINETKDSISGRLEPLNEQMA